MLKAARSGKPVGGSWVELSDEFYQAITASPVSLAGTHPN